MIDENCTLDLNGIKEVNQNYYFQNKKLKKLIIGNTLEELEFSTFYECSNIKEIDFSNTTILFHKSLKNNNKIFLKLL